MCGIAGVAGPNGAPLECLAEMATRLAHRGPDGEGFAVVNSARDGIVHGHEAAALLPARRGGLEAGLAHRRLTIIDLSERSAQPMTTADGRVSMSYNGELYNYVELRRELEDLGHRFGSEGDTEVVLRAYEQWGSACVERFVGMWAFAILDLGAGILLLSRDRFGIKPLFWAPTPGGGIAFASELKALAAVPGLTWEPNPRAVRRFLLTGVVDESEETFIEGVRRLLPAENLVLPLREGVAGLRRERYWQPPQPSDDGADAAQRLRAALEDSVRIHLRSDVPLGTCLSGGIDSSGLVGICDQLRAGGEIDNYTHHAFGYVPPSGTYSEERYMRMAAQRFGAELTVVQPDDAAFQDALLDIVRAQDEPFGSLSIAAQWWVFKAARDGGMKVMLDGQGADEIFAGYHHFLISRAAELIRGRRGLAYLRFAREHRRFYGAPPIPWESVARSTRLARFLPAPRTPDGAPAAPLPSDLLAGDLLDGTRDPGPGAVALHDLLVEQTTRVSLPSLLRFEDRNSMTHSIEGRVPFLDHRVVDLAFSLPPETKLAGVMPKAVLRDALADLLPREILDRRDKIGFRADTSATHAFAARHADALREARTPWEAEWFDQSVVDRFIGGGDRSDVAEFTLWRLANVKLWLRMNWDAGRHPLEGSGGSGPLAYDGRDAVRA